MNTAEVDETAPPPGQNSDDWGDPIFRRAPDGTDWCTVRQAVDYRNSTVDQDERLRQIAAGTITSEYVTADDAQKLLEARSPRRRKEG